MAPLVDNEENAVINWCTGYKNPGIVDVGTDLGGTDSREP